MKLILNAKKPVLHNSSSALCSFRSGKAYLWGLVRDRLSSIQNEHLHPINILDAACHALITRDMFPEKSSYYGLDISTTRLQIASKRRNPNDVLYLADITKSLPLKYSFNCVVSCNTLCHLQDDFRLAALSNLVDCCSVGGDILFNIPLVSNLFEYTSYLLDNFDSVEPVYFDSYLSVSDEKNNEINQSNVLEKVITNELSLPNDATLHRQVIFHARSRVHHPSAYSSRPLRPNNIQKILKLTHIPSIKVRNFSDDSSSVDYLNAQSSTCVILLTSYLYFSDVGKHLVDTLKAPIHRLENYAPLDNTPQEIFILGLEDGWSDNSSLDRVTINRLKQVPTVSVNFILVSSRNGSSCVPSLVAHDV